MAVKLKLTRKQLSRLDELAEADDEIKVTDWQPELKGPVVEFPLTGAHYVVTRDGGLWRV